MQKKALLYSFDGEGHACWHIRLVDPFEAMQDRFKSIFGVVRKKNWLYKHKAITARPISRADLIVVQRFFPQPRTAQILERLQQASAPVVFDLDDNLIGLATDHSDYPALEKSIPYMRDFMPHADAVTVSTPELGKVLAPLNPNVHVLPNLINDRLWTGGQRSQDGKVVILFGGTPTHSQDAAMLEEVLLELYRRHPDKVAFTFMGCATERMAALPGVRFIEFQPSYPDYARRLQQEPIDIAVVPLEDTVFNRCKSNIKWLEYSMCGIPGVYAALPPYREVEQGRTGLLARSASDWLEALELLVREPEKRSALAQAAQQEVVNRFSLSRQVSGYAELYNRLMVEKRERLRQARRSWFGRLFGR